MAIRNTTDLYDALLRGRRKLVVWGATRNTTIHEWQRQIRPEFIADSQWIWWNSLRLHGLDVCSPSEIGRFNPSRVLVSNNFYYAPFAPKMADYLRRIGGFQTMRPVSLHEMAHALAQVEKRRPTRHQIELDQINCMLAGMLTSPDNLQKPKQLPGIRELKKFFGSYTANDYLAEALPCLREENAASLRPKAGHVCLMIGALNPGGAERQLCNLAIGLQRAGWTPTVIVYAAGGVETAHYRQLLADAGVGYFMMNPPESGHQAEEALIAFKGLSQDMMITLWHMRAEIVLPIVHTYLTLRRLRPELLIGYLDWQNIYSAVGGMLAGVPQILMSGRNAAPTHFPHFYGSFTDTFKDTYRLALRQPGIVLSNNSAMGAQSYARWLEVPKKKIPAILNCITEEFLQPIPTALIEAKRYQLHLRKGQPFILGVFRLAPEKRPLDFIRVVARLHKRHSALRAVICGSGQLEGEVRALIRKLKLEEVIVLQGVVGDIPLMMRTATLLLHTSEAEGSPNALLEAQACGLPIVCTDSGGTRACLAPGWLPYINKVGDIKGLADGCHMLLEHPKLRKKIAAASHTYILRRFSVAELTRNTLRAAGITADDVACRSGSKK